MKKLFFLLIIFYFSKSSIGQKIEKDIQIVEGLNKDAIEKIIDFLDVNYQKYAIAKRLKNNFCNLIIDEYQKGKVVKTINLRNEIKDYDKTLFIADNLTNDKFIIELFSRKILDTTLKLRINIGGLGYESKLKLIDSLHYSWKDVVDISKKGFKINPDSTLPLLTYASAIGQKFTNYPGNIEFCRINNELIPFKNWYEKLGVEHYFIFSLRFEKE